MDLARGSFGGVALGDSDEKVQRVFGRKAPAKEGEPWTALSIGDHEDYSPRVVTLNKSARPAADVGHRYEYAVFMVSASKVGAIIVNDPDARATGVGMGDELEQARASYPVRCGTANEGTEYEPFPACVGRTAPGVHVWFGGDPIRNITVTRVRPDGV